MMWRCDNCGRTHARAAAPLSPCCPTYGNLEPAHTVLLELEALRTLAKAYIENRDYAMLARTPEEYQRLGRETNEALGKALAAVSAIAPWVAAHCQEFRDKVRKIESEDPDVLEEGDVIVEKGGDVWKAIEQAKREKKKP